MAEDLTQRREGRLDETVPELSRALPIALLHARETVLAPMREHIAASGLTEQKWRVLRTLLVLGEVEQSAIAREACLLLPSLTRILAAMERDGLVTRRGDPRDRRRTLVLATDEGRRRINDHMQDTADIDRRLREAYGEERLETLLDLLVDLRGTRF